MNRILVVPHGGRWAVKESPDRPPVAEYETLALAELAARGLARERGAEVVVSREDDRRFDRPANVHAEGTPDEQTADASDQRTGDARGTEEARQPQAGL